LGMPASVRTDISVSPFSIWMTCSTAVDRGDVAAFASGGCRRAGRRGRARIRDGSRRQRGGDGLDGDRPDCCHLDRCCLGGQPQGARGSGEGGKPRIEHGRGVTVDEHRGQKEVFLGQLLIEIAESRDFDDRCMPGNMEIRLGGPQGDGKAHEGDAEGEGERATGKGPLGGYAGSRSQLVFPSVQWFGRQGSTPVRPSPPAGATHAEKAWPTDAAIGRQNGRRRAVSSTPKISIESKS
jgi:hypothetical protein